MNKRGKITNKWLKVRKQWMKENPPNHQGYYFCYICYRAVPSNEVTLDHIIPRSRRPDLRFDFSNLAPCCGLCNYKKGSKNGKTNNIQNS